MKIHYLVTSLETGGAEFAIPDIVTTLKNLGHDISIIACEPRDSGAVSRLIAAGLSYRLLASRRRFLPIILARYLSIARRERPEIIWTSLSFANLVGQYAGKLLNIPVVSFKHSASVRRYTYRLRHSSALWIGDSQTVVDYLQQQMGISADKVMAWPLFQYDHYAPQANYWDGKSRLQIGSVGRLHEVKHYAALIDALGAFLARYPTLRDRLQLTILGDGPERERLEDKVIEWNLQDIVSLPGFSDQVPTFMAGLHLYVQPSRYEGMCLALHEAMNVGLPVMATPVGEMRDAVQEGKTGFVLVGELDEAFASALQQIFATPNLLQEYGMQARRYVATKFSHQQFVQAAERIVAKLPVHNTLA